MRVLMIGGTALTGPHLIRQLLARPKVQVFTLSRHGARLFAETPLQGDRRDPQALAGAFARARPDVVVDMVPFTAPDALGLVAALHRQARAVPVPVPVIACSSCDVYAAYGRIHGTEKTDPQACPITEDMALRRAFGPEGAAYDKTGVERVLLQDLADVAILRLPAIYGWPDSTRIAPYLDPMLDGADRVEVPARRAEFRFSRSLHKNAAHAVALAALAGQTGQHIYNVAEPRAWTELEWAAHIAACCGWRGRIVAGDGQTAVDQHLTISSDRIRRELGYSESHDPMAGLAEAVAFHSYRRRGVPYVKGY